MSDLIIFELLIPCTDNSTGMVHSPEKFDNWLIETADKFGGVTVLGIGLLGLWYDEDLRPEENPVEDNSNWYKIGVPENRIEELRSYLKKTTSTFGQKCLYFERAGEADFLLPP